SAKEEDAELCYELVFSADRKWVTILFEDDTEAKNKASAFARDLGMQVLSVELVDSDFAELTLFGLNGAPVDTMFLGEPYFDEVPEPSPLKWQTMLGIDWAKVEEIQQGDHTFAEDALCEFGEVIGCENILADYYCVSGNAERLFFKRAGKKKLTLDSAYKQIFGEKLIPIGFKYIGGRSFVRVINNEIIQTVSFIKETTMRGYFFSDGSDVRYNIYYGVSSIYSNNLLIKPDSCCSGFETLCHCYISNYCIYGRNDEYLRQIKEFYFKSYEQKSLLQSMSNALNVFEKIVLPLFDKSLDLESTLYYFDNISVPSFSRALYLKLDDPKAFFEKIKERKIQELEYSIQNGLNQKVPEKYDEYIEKIEKRITDYLSFIDETKKDKNEYNNKRERLSNNRECNLEIIKQQINR
ncbi:hypothetical protein, partial [Ruminococcus albus]